MRLKPAGRFLIVVGLPHCGWEVTCTAPLRLLTWEGRAFAPDSMRCLKRTRAVSQQTHGTKISGARYAVGSRYRGFRSIPSMTDLYSSGSPKSFSVLRSQYRPNFYCTRCNVPAEPAAFTIASPAISLERRDLAVALPKLDLMQLARKLPWRMFVQTFNVHIDRLPLRLWAERQQSAKTFQLPVSESGQRVTVQGSRKNVRGRQEKNPGILF
jgi:hypothetical protein